MGQSTRGNRVKRSTSEPRDARRLLALLSSMRDLVLVRDSGGLLTYCSPSVSDALGYQPGELEGTPERDLIHASDVDARDDLVEHWVLGEEPLPPIELRMHDRSGAWHWFETIEINRLDDPDVNGIVTNARDVTARKAESAELLERSLRDPLTGIPNRLALMERLEVALSRAERSRDLVAVLFCDLDDFKLVNDGYGHEFADGVLVEVARRLERLQRKSDTVARIGGDEFVVVCDGLHDIEESTAIASRIHAAIEEPIVFDGRQCLGHREHRYRDDRRRLRRTCRSRDPDPQRRRRDVPRQTTGTRALAPVRRCARREATGDSSSRPISHRRWAGRVRPALPADPRARPPHHRRRRGLPAVGTPVSRLPAARTSSSRSPSRTG